MYRNYKKKKTDSSRFFFTTVAVIACVLVGVAVIASPSFFVKTTGPDDYTTTASTSNVPADTSSAVENTTDVPPATSETPAETSAEVTETTEPTPQTAEEPVTSAPETTAEPPAVPSDAVLAESEDAGKEYLDKIIFIGDSTTYSFLYYGKLNGGKESLQVWTPASRTLTLDHATTTTVLYPDTGEEIVIKEAVARKKPEIIVITLGVNGISYMNEEYFKSSYSKLVGIIQKESPDTRIILQSIFPVATNWEKTKSINNEKITNANAWIRTVAKECGVHYLDTISVLAVDEGGYLPQSYQNGDGLHLSPAACDIVLNYIRTHALPEYVQ